jgi:hypothetical protein
MADGSGIWTIAVSALVDVFVTETAKRQRWIRIVNFISSMLFLAMIVGVIYITFRYSM